MTKSHKLTTTERGLGWQWRKLRLTILRRDGYLCQLCWKGGRATEATEVDHIVPRHKDGSDDPENLQGLCSPCHKAKTRADVSNRPAVGLDGWPV
ncbi:HNH endonuclease [Sulfitobacter pontiacus]|uniref:HNH endonuclease n=1 Tax=Sulfitobacter pontiacus TaxID=60137 RepID=UPI003263F637